MPETAVFAHYEVLKCDDGSLFELGRGAMGVTYKAFDRMLQIPVALKVIYGANVRDEAARERFAHLTRAAAQLHHRYAASIFYFGIENDTCFYAMEFIKGESLQSFVDQHGPLHPSLALTITGQVAQVLAAATQFGLVHRDIKPANLMLTKADDEIVTKVVEFGMAGAAVAEGEELPSQDKGNFIGTPYFASPEQLMEKAVDVRSDIYSLGVTLWYMLSGQLPFAGSIAKVMSQHFSNPPPFEQLANAPPSAIELLRKMLAKAPEDRYQTPAELRAAIDAAQEKIGGWSGGGAARVEPVRVEQAARHETPTARDLAPVAPQEDLAEPMFDDDIRFTVYRPQAMAPESWEIWLAFAHRSSDGIEETDYAAEVEEQARGILGSKFDDFVPAQQESGAALPREGTITVVPTIEGLEFNPPQRSFTWQDPVHREEFLARATAAHAGTILRGRVTFFLGALVVAEINVKVTIAAANGPAAVPQMVPDQAKPYRNIFASYSRKDVAIVEHFERMIGAFGDRYLRDLQTLRAGEEWSPGLERMIREADVFQLFWSHNAMRSRHVRQEWNFALGLGRPNFVRPTYWETPFPKDEHANLPPPDLRRLHFERLPVGFEKNNERKVWSGAFLPSAPPSSRAAGAVTGDMKPVPMPGPSASSSNADFAVNDSEAWRQRSALLGRRRILVAAVGGLLLASALVVAILQWGGGDGTPNPIRHDHDIVATHPTPVEDPERNVPTFPGPVATPGFATPEAIVSAEPPRALVAVEAEGAPVPENEKKTVKEEVLTRIEFMKISPGNKDKLHSAVETARDMRKILIIPFDTGKTDLSADFVQQLRTEVNRSEILRMRADPSAVFVILGYADLRGTAEINKVYSQRRADVVRDTLRDQCGVLNIMHSFGMGASKLLDAHNLAKNRITEIWVVLP